VQAVNRFNLETRKSSASTELEFVESQVAEKAQSLRVAEDRMQSFLQQNRSITGSPQLTFERERLQRELSLQQELHAAFLKNREEARIRQVRNTPVITVIEEAEVPMFPEPRRLTQKTAFGGLVGAMLGILFAFLANSLARARRAPTEDTTEFFKLMEDVVPRFLRRRGSRAPL
jgi:uncharacterized protein involved in exopolysaccharide biosynthesis